MRVKDHIKMREYLEKKNGARVKYNREFLLNSLTSNYKNKLENLLDSAEVNELDDGNYEIVINYEAHDVRYLINKKLLEEK